MSAGELDTFLRPYTRPDFPPDRNDQQVSRAYVEAGLCPVCAAGPFAIVASHVVKAHDIDKFTLRDMCGALRQESICDPGYSAARSRLLHRRLREGFQPPRAQPGARAVLSARARELRKANPDQVSHARRVSRDLAIARGQRYLEFWQRGLSLAAIAAECGVRPATVTQGLRRVGVEPGAEAVARGARERLPHLQDTLSARTEARISRFLELGGDLAAADHLARELGISTHYSRLWLRRRGVELPHVRGQRPSRAAGERSPCAP